MPLLTDQLRSELRDAFADRLDRPVELRLVVSAQPTDATQGGCPSCEAARKLMEDVVAAAPERLSLTVVDLDSDPDDPRAEGASDTPTLLIPEPGQPARIATRGSPGYEFATVVDAISRASAADAGIKPANAGRPRRLMQSRSEHR